MAKKKEVEEVSEELVGEVTCESCAPISPITETFGSGDLNILRDKINEIVHFVTE